MLFAKLPYVLVIQLLTAVGAGIASALVPLPGPLAMWEADSLGEYLASWCLLFGVALFGFICCVVHFLASYYVTFAVSEIDSVFTECNASVKFDTLASGLSKSDDDSSHGFKSQPTSVPEIEAKEFLPKLWQVTRDSLGKSDLSELVKMERKEWRKMTLWRITCVIHLVACIALIVGLIKFSLAFPMIFQIPMINIFFMVLHYFLYRTNLVIDIHNQRAKGAGISQERSRN